MVYNKSQPGRIRLGLRPIVVVAVASLCAVISAGCWSLVVPAVVSAGGMAAETYLHGEYGDYVDVPFRECTHVVEDVARRFRLETVRWEDSDIARVLYLRNVEGDPFRIRIEPLAANSTRVTIRAGVWGDDVCSAKLMSEIRKSVDGATQR